MFFGDMLSCRIVDGVRFGGKYYLLLQEKRVSHNWKIGARIGKRRTGTKIRSLESLKRVT
jgi:hypothetical protein